MPFAKRYITNGKAKISRVIFTLLILIFLSWMNDVKNKTLTVYVGNYLNRKILLKYPKIT